jgi:hypothetical protein
VATAGAVVCISVLMAVIVPRLSLSKVNKHIAAHLLMVTVLSGDPLLIIQTLHLPQCLRLLQRPRCHHLRPLILSALVECPRILKDLLLSLANMLVTSLLNSLLLLLPVHQDHTLTATQRGGMVGVVGVVVVVDRGADGGVLQVLLTDITTPLDIHGTSLITNTVRSAPR